MIGTMLRNSAERILGILKTRGPQAAQRLSKLLEMTPEGARQHLGKLVRLGLVQYRDEREQVGRPKRVWSLSEKGNGRFPDGHSLLTLEIFQSVRSVFGEEGLESLISHRERETLRVYETEVSKCDGLKNKISRLAKLRDREGYMTEWREINDGAFILTENHCPICAAAQACLGICRSELEIFRSVLGPGAEVIRTEHILQGARRCSYRITPVR